MSIASWKKEFYHHPSKRKLKKMKPSQVVELSLKKWIGLTTTNLNRHKVKVSNVTNCMIPAHRPLYSRSRFMPAGGLHCTLCSVYWNDFSCGICPLLRLRNGDPCYRGINNPYGQFIKSGNPKPMIDLLAKAYLSLSMEGN